MNNSPATVLHDDGLLIERQSTEGLYIWQEQMLQETNELNAGFLLK
jgi:hypothetical protein